MSENKRQFERGIVINYKSQGAVAAWKTCPIISKDSTDR